MAGKMNVTYILSIILIIATSIYLAIFSGSCQKLTAGCVPLDSTTGQLGLAGIGLTIGMLMAIVFTFMKPVLCSWPHGIGTILLMVLIASLLITSAAITMGIYNKPKFNDKGVEIDPTDKLISMWMNSVLFLSMGIGIIYAVLMNMMSIAVGRRPVAILASTLIPIAIYSIVVGIIILSAYNKAKDKDGICRKHSFDESTNLSGIANIVGDNKNPPSGLVLGMTIGAGVFLLLISIALYFTRGRM
jgi:hypothetical protein